MITVDRPGKPGAIIPFAEAMGLLLSVLTRRESQPSVLGDVLSVHVNGRAIASFTGKGNDFKQFQGFYFAIGPVFWQHSHDDDGDSPATVLRVLREHFGMSALNVPLVITDVEQKVRKAVEIAIKDRLHGNSARKHFEQSFGDDLY